MLDGLRIDKGGNMIDFDSITRKQDEYRRRLKAAEALLKEAKRDPPGKRERNRTDISETLKAAKETEAELSEMARDLLPMIDRLNSHQHRDTMRKHYREGKTIKRTATEMGYSVRQINRFLFEAKAIINQTKGKET